jgi:iron complex transport system ATP-binding protein
MIAAEQLGFSVQKKTILDGVDLALEPGRVTAVLGPNGAGKSTLLKLLSGELSPSAGEVRWGDRPLRRVAPRDLATRRSVMPQASSLTFPFSAFEVVMLGRTPHIRRKETARDVEAVWGALERANAAHLAERRYTTLSGGERQRVDFARAVAQIHGPGDHDDEGRALMLDEPTSSLDLSNQHDLLRRASGLAEQGVAVLVILHDLNLASTYADRIVVLAGGQVVAEGAPWAVLTPEIVRAAFGLSVVVTSNPCGDCPLIVPDTRAPDSRAPAAGTLASAGRVELPVLSSTSRT